METNKKGKRRKAKGKKGTCGRWRVEVGGKDEGRWMMDEGRRAKGKKGACGRWRVEVGGKDDG